MSIREIRVRNNKIIAYDLPSNYKNSENIGNKLEDFEILQVLGQGSFGFIAKVKSKLNLEIYALKKIRPDKIDKKVKMQFQIEKIFSKKLNHPNICKILSDFEENDEEYFIMKFFNNKDLFKYLVANSRLGFYIKEDFLWEIFYQCLEGLTYLHNQGIIHRDIKLGNIFMDDNRNIQIGDFGTCAVIDEKKAKNFTNNPQEQKLISIIPGVYVGSPNYIAPEIENGQPYDQRADVYSLGITFYVLCFYRLPYFNGGDMQEMKNDNFYSYELKNIIYKMIQRDKNNRPTSSDIYCLFKKEYIKKYVKNSGIYSTIQCFSNYSNIGKYFSNYIQISQALESDCPKKLFYILVEIFNSLEDKNIDEYLYILRHILYEEGIKKKDHEEISPLQVLNIILNSLKYELNEKKLPESPKSNSNSYLHIEEIPGEEGIKYNEFIKKYKELFNSIISNNFRGVLKIKRECENGHSNYLFRIFHFISFNCDILTTHLNTNFSISIYECFNCLNGKQNFLDLDKYIKCENCQKIIKQKETRTFYETPNNLIIAFDRGNNNRNKIKINFEENITFNSFQVEKNYDNTYHLIGVISEMIENNGTSKYISFIKKNNKWLLFNLGQAYNGLEIKNFDFIKNTGNLIALFYIRSFINSQNFIFNNINANVPFFVNNLNGNNIFNNNVNGNNIFNNNVNGNNIFNNNFNNNFNNANNVNNLNNNNMNSFNNNNNFRNYFKKYLYNMDNMDNMQNYCNFNNNMNNNFINMNNNNINLNNNMNNNFINMNNNNINLNNDNNFNNNMNNNSNMNNFNNNNISNVHYFSYNNLNNMNNNINNNMNNNMNNFYNPNYMNNLK